MKSSITINGQSVQVHPQLLFQHLIITCQSSDIEVYFKFELCTFPAALFEYPDMLKEPQKSFLVDALWSMVAPETSLLDLPTGGCSAYSG